jgi:RNA polymerase sigma-70 factor (ECF subfamily)
VAAGGDELVNKASAGDGAALAALLTRHGPDVGRHLHINSVWQAVLDPADVMQVTYLEAFLDLNQLQARTEGEFVAWLTRLAQNNLRDAIKELERGKRCDPRQQIYSGPAANSSVTRLYEMLGATAETPSRNAARMEAGHVLAAALARLPAPYAEVIRQHDLEGRPIADVAAALRRSPGAVYLLRLRALDRLRAVLGSESRFFSGGA